MIECVIQNFCLNFDKNFLNENIVRSRKFGSSNEKKLLSENPNHGALGSNPRRGMNSFFLILTASRTLKKFLIVTIVFSVPESTINLKLNCDNLKRKF